MTAPERRWTWGAELHEDGASFRLWAPAQSAVQLRLDAVDRAMEPEEDGWFALTVPGAKPGATYGFVLEDGFFVPDPAARAQAGDVHGPSRLVDPAAYEWKNPDWPGRGWHEAVITELHVGTFTPEGTFRAAIDRLGHLAQTGVTAIELMPVAQFGGARGWGYDGVLLYAPHNAYGAPEDLKALVDAAHGHGLMVLLDVVYNHFGPDGNYIAAYAPDFFHPEEPTPWGAAIAYDRAPARRFCIENALYWIEEFRLDGLRFDAVDHVRDPDSNPEILVEMAERLRAAHPGRDLHLTTEDNRNITRLHERRADGSVPHFTAEWNDDLHNVVHLLATGESEGYYIDFAEGHWPKYARALAEGYAFQGEPSPHAGGKPRGAPSGHLPPIAFVDFLHNHDQIGNRAFGERLTTLTHPPILRALTAILLLSPHIPLMFMGDEWGETRPFGFFTDFDGALAEVVREGRRKEFRQFSAFQDPAIRATIPDPNALGTFEASRIDWDKPDTPEGAEWLAFTRDLLSIRHREIVPMLARAGGDSGTVVAADEGLVAIDWRLDGGFLRLRANLSDYPLDLPGAAGRVIYANEGAVPGAALPPHSVIISVDPAA